MPETAQFVYGAFGIAYELTGEFSQTIKYYTQNLAILKEWATWRFPRRWARGARTSGMRISQGPSNDSTPSKNVGFRIEEMETTAGKYHYPPTPGPNSVRKWNANKTSENLSPQGNTQ